MQRQTALKALIVVLGLAAAWACGRRTLAGESGDSAAPAAQPAAPPAAPSSAEVAAAKAEKLISSVRDKMNDFQKEEFHLEMASMKSMFAASQGIKDLGKAADQIAKDAMTPELRVYRAAVLGAAGKWHEFQQRYSGIGRTLSTLERDRAGLPKKLQDEIDSLAMRFDQKNRGLVMKVADMYERVAEYRGALAIYGDLYKDIPEDKRKGERALKEKIAGLCEKVGDPASALGLVKGIVEDRPEKDRYKDRKLGEWLGRLYEKTGDIENALEVCKKTLNAVPADKRAKDGAALKKKIGELEKKLSAGQK